MKAPVVIRIDIPALSDYVAYLRESDSSQAEVDALTARVEELTAGLNKTTGDLEDAVNKEK